MKLGKAFLLFVILILTAGIVSAVDISNFKAPSNFEGDGNSSFYELNELGILDENGISIEVFTEENMKETQELIGSDEDTDKESFFKNDTSLNYTVENSDEENIFFFSDGVNELKGYVELIQIGDDEIIIESNVDFNASDDKIKQSLDVLKEFNKLNDFKLISPNLND